MKLKTLWTSITIDIFCVSTHRLLKKCTCMYYYYRVATSQLYKSRSGIYHPQFSIIISITKTPDKYKASFSADRIVTWVGISLGRSQLCNTDFSLLTGETSVWPYTNTSMNLQQPAPLIPPVHPDVQMKPLPFYDVLDVLIKPSSLGL